MANGRDVTQIDPSRPKQLNRTVAGTSAGNCDSTSGGMGSLDPATSAADADVPAHQATYPELQTIPGGGGYLIDVNFPCRASFRLTTDTPDIPHSYNNGSEEPGVSDSPSDRHDRVWWLYRMQQTQLQQHQQAMGYTTTGWQTAAVLNPATDTPAAAPLWNGAGAATELHAATPSSVPSYDSMGAMGGSLLVAGVSGGDGGEADDYHDDDDEYGDNDNDDDGHDDDLLRDIHVAFGHGHEVDGGGATA